MKRLLLLASLLAVALPGTASAGTPCRNKVFNDWYRDGKISSAYAPACYRDALKHIPDDAGIYSNLSDDVRAALRAAQRRATGAKVPSEVGHGFKALGKGGIKGTLASISSTSKAPNDHAGSGGSGGSLADTASNAPLPILVLGGIALALIAAGGIGAGVRHARSRRQ